MLVSYTPPEINARAFSCPHCGVFARQDWGLLYRNRLDINNGRLIVNQDSKLHDFLGTSCENCGGNTLWFREKIIFPFNGAAIQPNEDMPEAVKELFLEAREILFLSPRGASALLRLALQKLCVFLGGMGENAETDINHLVDNGLPPKLVQALHTLKTYGKSAVAPGMISEDDDVETAQKLLAFINIICDNQLTQPRLIDHFAAGTEPPLLS